MDTEQEPGTAASSPPAPAQCRRCGRDLHAAASVELGLGPDCARILERTVVSATGRRTKVLELELPMERERPPVQEPELPLEP